MRFICVLMFILACLTAVPAQAQCVNGVCQPRSVLVRPVQNTRPSLPVFWQAQNQFRRVFVQRVFVRRRR